MDINTRTHIAQLYSQMLNSGLYFMMRQKEESKGLKLCRIQTDVTSGW